jgi:hypothetical protein
MIQAQNSRTQTKNSAYKAPNTPKQSRKHQAKSREKQQAFPENIHITQKQLVALVCGPISIFLVRDALRRSMEYEQRLYGDWVSILLRHWMPFRAAAASSIAAFGQHPIIRLEAT